MALPAVTSHVLLQVGVYTLNGDKNYRFRIVVAFFTMAFMLCFMKIHQIRIVIGNGTMPWALFLN
jgi:hypothetical protein